MINKLFTCLWYNGNARQAAEYYCTVFSHSKQIANNNYVSIFTVEGTKIMCLNGGPQYKHTPAISQFVTSEDDEEIKMLWEKLSAGGKVLMALGKYDWSENYGWCEDQFGVSWQIYKGKMDQVKQKIVPCLLFVGNSFGKAEEAVKYYTSIIENSKTEGILKYENTNSNLDGTVMHSQCRLNDAVFMAMDGYGEHKYTFSPATSFVIECETQDEIDLYWDHLGKEGTYSRCGWLDDKFGVSWQIIPKVLGELMNNPAKAPKVIEAFLKMTKFDIEGLINAN